MKLKVDFGKLERLVTTMGATPLRWRSRDNQLADPEFLARLYQGLEVEPKDVDIEDNLFSYRGERVLLYIKETGQDRHTLLYDTEKAKRFHVADCSALEAMRRQGRFDMRYVVTTRTDGKFPVFASSYMSGSVDEIEAPLKVCRSCLMKIGFRGYGGLHHQEKRNVWLAFDIGEFLWENPTSFRSKPTYTDRTAPMPGTAPDWMDTVHRYRRFRQWACDECGVSLKTHPSLIYVRPRDGNTWQARLHNLVGTCPVCSAGAQGDAFAKADRDTAERLRAEQGIR